MDDEVDFEDAAVFYLKARPAFLKLGFYDVSGVDTSKHEDDPHKDVAELVADLQEQADSGNNNTPGAGSPGSSVIIIYRYEMEY
jgi:hypothetical protein